MPTAVPMTNGDSQGYQIIDIRPEDGSSQANPEALQHAILAGLQKPHNEKTLPGLILYSEEGLKLFEKVTYLPEYYLTDREIDLLHREGSDIAREIPDGAFLVELGAGPLRKTTILLDILEKQQKHISYFGLDLDRRELDRTLQEIAHRYKNVSLFGLHGTYDDGREWLTRQSKEVPKIILWLGSSIGNMTRGDGGEFIGTFGRVLGPQDRFLVAVDSRNNDPAAVRAAYNEPAGVSAKFVLYGLKNMNDIFGEEVVKVENFAYNPFYNENAGRHESYYRSLCDQEINLRSLGAVIRVRPRELIRFAMSCKYDDVDAQVLSEVSGAELKKSWSDSENRYYLHMLSWNGETQETS